MYLLRKTQIMKTANAQQRKIVLDKSIPNCYNMYMKKRWNVAKELERSKKKRANMKPIPWRMLLLHPLTWLLFATFIAGVFR